ncbi:MAG: hypothetical protein WC688_05440 [Parachlamydiales bacterium]|jgi:hypothetical protein
MVNNLGSKKVQVNVEFIENFTMEQIVNEISQLSNPQIIIWYIGIKGLTKTCADFYKNFLISPIFKKNLNAKFWLVDLTAWGAFKNPLCSIHKNSSFCDIIENFSDNRIKCIKSAKIFKKMQEISEQNLIDYFRKALRRNFIQKTSKSFPKINISIKKIFSNNCPIMLDWYDNDANKSYSVFQYLEGCLLINEILIHFEKNKIPKDFQIVFALPNDEFKYYKDNLNSFQKDVEFFIKNQYPLLENFYLKVNFFSFKYGSQTNQRPYNALGKHLKKSDFLYDRIITQIEEIQNCDIDKEIQCH